MANLMGETTSRIASAARPEYEEAIVGENVSSEPRDGNVLHSSETSHFTDISAAPPPYSPGAEHDLQEARQCRSAERAAIGAQGTSSPYQSRTPAFHAAGAQQALVDTAIPARPRDEPRGVAAAAVGPSTRSELGRPQPTGFNMQKQYASRPLLLGTVTGDEGTFPSHQRQNLHPQARPSKGSPDMGNASCLPPPTRHAASYSKMQPPVTYGRDTTIYPQTGPMNSNELARRFAQEALSGSRGGISHPLHGGGQR
ncbi:hypothetical protein F5I97DRAFT_958882 [Phlebopus sp. FC_14]|nr:hypothetical protein F5I97DRAFT_958882 [Phlebopus sp. FC_14]